MTTLLQLNLNDQRGGRFTAEVCRLLLNSAFKDVWSDLIAKQKYFARVSLDVTFISGSQEVDLVDNLQKIILVQDVDQIPIPVYDEFKSKKSEVASVYLINVKKTLPNTIRKKLGWYRLPSSSFTLTVIYVPTISQFQPDGLNSDMIEEIPEEYHNVVVSWATVLALGTDESAVNYWTGIYQKQIGEIQESSFPEEVVDYYYGY